MGSIIFALKDSKGYVTKWNSPTSSHADVTAVDYTQTWTLPDGTKFTTDRRITVSNLVMVYAYRTNTLSSTLPTTWTKANAKIYMQNPKDSALMEYDPSTTMGFTSAKNININMASNWWYNTPDTSEDGKIYCVIDIDSGLPATTYTVKSTLENITFENEVSTIKQNTAFSFVFNANEGYQIDTLTCNIGTVAISSDKLSAVITGTATTNIVITGSASELPKQYTVDYTLIDMVCDNPITTITENEDFTLTFSPNTGHEITTLTCNIGTVTIAEDKQSATITGTATENIVITGTATQIKAVYAIGYSLTNMSCVSPIYSIVEGTEFNLYFTADSGFVIDSLTTTLGEVEIAEDKKSATITGVATDNISIVGSASKEKHYVKITGSFNNCYCSYADGEVIDTTKPCEIIANTGYVFPTKLMYSYTAVIDGENVTKYATIDMNGYRLVLDFVFDDVEATIILDSEYTAEKEVDKISDFVDAYCVDNSIIQQLAGVRFLQITSSTGDVSFLDMGQFIVGLYALPLGVPDKLVTATKAIKLGYKSTNVTAPIINGYKWEYDLGVINIPATYNNGYDFVNTDVFLNVPYFGRIEVPSYLVGYEITIKILFDCYSGNGTLVIENNFTKSAIEMRTQKIVTDVPYIQTGMDTVFNKLGNTNVNPLINKCFVEVIRNTPYQTDNTFGKKVDEIVVIGSVQGYAEFNECLIKSSTATDTELDTIARLLNSGVIIA